MASDLRQKVKVVVAYTVPTALVFLVGYIGSGSTGKLPENAASWGEQIPKCTLFEVRGDAFLFTKTAKDRVVVLQKRGDTTGAKPELARVSLPPPSVPLPERVAHIDGELMECKPLGWR